MYPAENKWQSLAQHNTFDLSKKFEVQIAIVKPPDGPPHVSIRKYAKYLTSSERKQGISVHEMVFRPMKEGVLFPACKFNDLLKAIKTLISDDGKSCQTVPLFSTGRLSELRVNVINPLEKGAVIIIEKWAQLSNCDRARTGIERLFPTTKISIPARCWQKYLNSI